MALKRLFQIGTCFFFCFFVGSCNKNSESSLVLVTISPGQPSVITGNYVIGTQTIQAPWFEFVVTVTNNSPETVSIIGLQVSVTAIKSDGTKATNIVTVSPGQYNYTLACNDATSADIQFTDFGQFAPGESGPLALTYRLAGTLPTACQTANPNITPATFFIGGNPDKATQQVVSFTYDVEMQPLGWFGTLNQPDKRFDKTVFFSTQ